MMTKVVISGDTLGYMRSKKDKMGIKREQEPELLFGDPDLARAFLEAQAPPFVNEVDQSRRTTDHLRRHNTHLIDCFSERQAVVDPILKDICCYTQDVLLAGMPRASLAIIWYKHGQAVAGHTHGALIHSLLTGHGFYEPHLSAALLQHHARLVSRARGLSDPLDPGFCLLVRSGWASWKPENIPLIKEVIARTQELWLKGEIRRHEHLEQRVLQEMGFEILVAPRPDGQPEVRLEFRHEPALPKYRNCMTVRHGERLIVLQGPLVRPGFDALRWKQTLERRTRKVDELRRSPLALYEEFIALIEERIAFQQSRYGFSLADGVVQTRDFECLLSEPSPKVDPDDTPEAELERVTSLPEIYFPFAVDEQEIVWDVDDPRIATQKVELDPQLAAMESEEEVIWPRGWLPQEREDYEEQLRRKPSPTWFQFEPEIAPAQVSAPAPQPEPPGSILGGIAKRIREALSDSPKKEESRPAQPVPAPRRIKYDLTSLRARPSKKRTRKQLRAQVALMASQEAAQTWRPGLTTVEVKNVPASAPEVLAHPAPSAGEPAPDPIPPSQNLGNPPPAPKIDSQPEQDNNQPCREEQEHQEPEHKQAPPPSPLDIGMR